MELHVAEIIIILLDVVKQHVRFIEKIRPNIILDPNTLKVYYRAQKKEAINLLSNHTLSLPKSAPSVSIAPLSTEHPLQ